MIDTKQALFKSEQVEFSVKKGFSLPDKEQIGVGGALHYPATYNEAANFENAALRDLNQNLPVNISEITNIINNIPIRMEDGTVAAPGMPFNNDIDTGFYRSGANSLDISSGGTRTAGFSSSAITFLRNLLFSTDGTLDIGAVGATRPRNLYLSDDVIADGFITFLAGNASGNTVTLIHYNNTSGNRNVEIPVAASGDNVILVCDGLDISTGAMFAMPSDGASPNPRMGVISPNLTATPKFLSMTGDGSSGAIPTWEEISTATIPAAVVKNQFAATATGTVSNTATETSVVGTGVGTKTLSADQLAAGTTLRIHAKGIYSTQNPTPTTLNMRVKLGSTTICATGDQTPAANMANRYWSIDCIITCSTAGSSGTVFGQAAFEHMQAATGGLQVWEMTNTTTATVNTTGTLVLDITADWGAGVAAADSISCTDCSFEVMR